VTKADYSRNLDANIDDLLLRMKSFSYRPKPARRTYIPKPGGKTRPLGIPSYEDKLVQGVMAKGLSVPGRIVTFSIKTGFLGHWKRDLAI
jgi:hypothetical protein